jgi:Ca-activated chloride channel homolog
MKKVIGILVLAVLVFSMLLSACGQAATTIVSRTNTQSVPSATTTYQMTQTTIATVTQSSIGGKDRYSGQAPPTVITLPQTTATATQPYYSPSASGESTIGLATGGAKDIGNFRENIKNNYLPLPTDVTTEGLFYDYYFDTGATEPSQKLFSPSYSFAVTRDPLSNKTDYYLSVGLNSGMKESDFQRKKLNLAIVLDNSGSMGEIFNQYYYDQSGRPVDPYAGEGIYRKTKMQTADESVVSILNQLNSDDYYSIVTFNSDASLQKPMGAFRSTDMRTIQSNVLNIQAGGSTNLESGIKMATAQYRGLYKLDNYEFENRMIILTDAQPNAGDYSANGLMGMLKQNADNRIYTTVIGIGVDFNSQLIEEISKLKGANYYTVHSPSEFRERVEDEFEYMVTPLIFDLRLYFESDGWRIEKVFGSPDANSATGDLMKINTMFASKSVGGETKGGLVLLKLGKTSSAADQAAYLKVTYEDRNGHRDSPAQTVYLERTSPEYFENNGIRKGVLLARYATLLQNWLIDERQHVQFSKPWTPYINEDSGIVIPTESRWNQWERQSLNLTVSEPYRSIFRDFSRYFEAEMNRIGDDTLDQELDILGTLYRYR